jgi:electron transfer flavoprotein alpha subunit
MCGTAGASADPGGLVPLGGGGEWWTNWLTLPVADALAAAADRAEPAAVPAALLVAASPAGKDAGARLAARKGWGMLADITDLDGELVATQSVFGGTTTAHARVRAPSSPDATVCSHRCRGSGRRRCRRRTCPWPAARWCRCRG